MAKHQIEEVEAIPAEERTLGETLLLGVNNLWKSIKELTIKTNNHGTKLDHHQKVIDHLMAEITRHEGEIKKLRTKLHGMSVKAGKAKSAKTKMETELVTAQKKLDEAKRVLLH